MPAKNKSDEIHLTRIYDAPVKAVWEAWTDPTKAAHWWGPRGFTITTHSKDLRPGGHWRYTMHGPDGTDYPNTTQYFEVERYARLVYDHGGSDDRPPLFRVTVTFADLDGKTKMDMTMKCASAEAADETRRTVKKHSGESTWDRLAEYVGGKETFVINRSFGAPLDLMFEMWTNPKHFVKWLAPAGAEMRFIRADISPGGTSFSVITGQHGTMYSHVEYQKIEKPNLIVYKQQFCDENEKVSRHPLAPTWPETMLTTVTFSPEGPAQTRVTVTWEPVGANAAELATFIQAKPGMTQGWTGSFDKLDSVLDPAV